MLSSTLSYIAIKSIYWLEEDTLIQDNRKLVIIKTYETFIMYYALASFLLYDKNN